MRLLGHADIRNQVAVRPADYHRGLIGCSLHSPSAMSHHLHRDLKVRRPSRRPPLGGLDAHAGDRDPGTSKREPDHMDFLSRAFPRQCDRGLRVARRDRPRATAGTACPGRHCRAMIARAPDLGPSQRRGIGWSKPCCPPRHALREDHCQLSGTRDVRSSPFAIDCKSLPTGLDCLGMVPNPSCYFEGGSPHP